MTQYRVWNVSMRAYIERNRLSQFTRRLCLCIGALTFVAHADAGQFSVRVTDPTGLPVTDAVVYANVITGTPPDRPKREISVEQINKEFVPLVSVLQAGTLVNFPNRDTVRHHVYSFSPAKTFEIKLYSGVPGKPIMFEKAGEIVLGCNIHDTMLAYMLVVDTPIFSKTDKRGMALLDGLSAGEYEILTWYPGLTVAATPAPQKRKLSANDNAKLEFVFSTKPQNPAILKSGTGK